MPDFDMKNELLPGLPAYAGGRMSDTVYDAGEGLRGRFFDGNASVFEPSWTEEELRGYLARFQYYGYASDAPCEGDSADITFSDGASAFRVTREGRRITVRQTLCAYETMDEACLQRTVTNTDETAFSDYIDLLTSSGFNISWRNAIENNQFIELQRDSRRVYAAFMGNTGTARFTDARAGVSIADFGERGAPEGAMDICQFGLYYSYMRPGVSANCGMLYIIKLPDNALFIVDGGEMEQATDAACAEVMRVMRLISKTPEGERIPVAAWFCTHAHDDHTDLFGKLMRFHHDEIDLRRVLFNFPANANYALAPQIYVLIERINRYYPLVKYLKPQTGHAFTLAGVRFEILLTHGDNTGARGDELIGGFNDTSTILRITHDGVRFLFLGDMDNTAEGILLSHYGAQTLKCTALQAAHHLINRLDAAYPVMSPDIALVPQHTRRAMLTNEKYVSLLNTVPAQHQYYASCATDIFRAADGRLTLTERFPIEGGVYDHSQV